MEPIKLTNVSTMISELILVLRCLYDKKTRKRAELNIKLRTNTAKQYPDIIMSLLHSIGDSLPNKYDSFENSILTLRIAIFFLAKITLLAYWLYASLFRLKKFNFNFYNKI